MKNNSEVISTRSMGFGGSDAALAVAIAEKLKEGSPLTATMRKRLRVIKGMEEYSDTPSTPEMEMGHAFEDEMAARLGYGWDREGLLRIETSDPFTVFAHADFVKMDERGVHVVECKWSGVRTLDQVKEAYKWQLQQYYLLGCDIVQLAAYCLTDDKEEQVLVVEPIERDEVAINILRDSYKLIEEKWTTMDVSATSMNVDDFGEDVRQLLFAIEQKSVLVKDESAKLDELKSQLLFIMKENGAGAITTDRMNVNFVPSSESISFDSAKFKKENPELAEKYQKKTAKKEYLTIKIK